MRTSLDDLHLFCRIVETGSLRAAAAEIGTDPSNVTRRLTGLEQRLGVKLIARSRVRSTPTDAGARFHRALTSLLDQFSALENEIAGAASEPRGLLRVSAPTVFGARHVARWLHELQESAPRLEVDLVLSERPLDLVEHGIDIALRIGAVANPLLIARPLGIMLTALVAAPAYLARAGLPQMPSELERHAFVQHAGEFAAERLVLVGPAQERIELQASSRLRISGILGVMEAVIAGAGLNAGPLWLYAEAIARGDVVHVLPQWRPLPGHPHAVVQGHRYHPAKINAALRLFQARIGALPGILPVAPQVEPTS